MLRFLTAGESHGPALVAILEGMPAGVPIDRDAIAVQMHRRQGGYGRGRRMAIETDTVEIVSGVRGGMTLGTPVALVIRNRDWVNWQHTMAADAVAPPDATGAHRAPVTRPRPGHADLAGAVKYGHDDLRNVLERASARETAARVAVGSIARQFLDHVGIQLVAHVTAIGDARVVTPAPVPFDDASRAENSPVRCANPTAEASMILAIDAARAEGNTLGGTFEVIARGVPPGLGSHVQWDRRLDGRLAQAVVSVPAVKAVEIGSGVAGAFARGSEVHDEIVRTAPSGTSLTGLARPTNRAGGIEGGVSNGEEIRLTGYMKPIATLMTPLRSVNLSTGEPAAAAIERSDTCAVPAAAVIGEAVVAIVLADAFLEKFGGDSLADIDRHYADWRRDVAARFGGRWTDATTPAGPAGEPEA